MFYQQLNASSELNKQCAEKILDVLAQFDDSMKYHDQENTIPPDSTKPVSPVFPSSFAASRQGSTLKTDQIFQRPKSIVYEPTVTTEDNNQVQRIDAPRSEGVSTNANYSYDHML
ncbi:hypothetical protein TRVA0_024S01486 [Trichomonascus vanleenenianus]|uniref:uncharacterized protein n=1 Tax=Trichomonascus vanleenenianus TaxID=2268995 RepID=UPI003EC97642